MQAFNENPELLLIVYALMALPIVIAIIFLGLIVASGMYYRGKQIEKAKKLAKIAGVILATYVVFELLTRAVL